MNYIYLLLGLIVSYVLWEKFKVVDIEEKIDVFYEEKNKNPTNIGFVKPENRLLNILNNISSGSKIKLSGTCNQYIYNKNTIDQDLNEKLTYLVKDIIGTINKISENSYFIKKIENVYCLIDRKANQRYIVDFFIYDVKNYYTTRMISDIVIVDDEIYLNYLHVQSASNSTIINNYDVKFNSIGILFDSNMFHEDLSKIFDNYYSSSFKVVGVNDSNLEYSKEDLTEVLTLNSLKNSYIPSNISPNSYKDLENKGLNGYLDMYLPENQNMIKSKTFCDKYKLEWDKYGIKNENDNTDKNCYLNNNATISEINEPYFAPGVVTKRVDYNRYSWLNNPANKNIIRTAGYSL